MEIKEVAQIQSLNAPEYVQVKLPWTRPILQKTPIAETAGNKIIPTTDGTLPSSS